MIGYRGLVTKLCRRFDFSGLYFNKQGVKCYNQLVNSNHFQLFVRGAAFELPTSSLFMGFDGLYDQLTLLDRPIGESPHFDFVKAIHNNANLDQCEYIRRLDQGTLDFRPHCKTPTTSYSNFRVKATNSLEAIQKNQMAPIMVFQIGQRYYVADGKHRAATCHFIGEAVTCLDLTSAIYDSFYDWIYRKMKKRPAEFSKHIRWFESAFELEPSLNTTK